MTFVYYPPELVDEVIQRNDIVDVISQYVRLKRTGKDYVGLCPFHNEKSGSFTVSRDKQLYHCFGCGVGGSVVTFVQNYENFTFPEAMKYLADRAGITLPEVEYTAEAKMKASKRQQLYEINKEAAKYFYFQLRSKPGEIGKKYFEERQLSEETMKNFGLGYSLQYSDDLVKYLKSKGYKDDIIKESGLSTFDERYGLGDKFINRVMFPIQDMNHKVIGFGGRVMGDFKPKYLNSPETDIFNKSINLYGLNFARTSRKPQIILCEGYMDVIAMHQAGFNQAVASLGTAFTSGQANLLKRFTKDVLLAYDSDGAGVKAALRAIEILRDTGLSGKVINMRPYKDPDEFIKNLGTEAFQERIDNAENSFLFEIRMLEADFNMEDPTEKTNFHKRIAEKLCIFEEEVERENYLLAVCEKYQINPVGLRKMVTARAAIAANIPQRQGLQSGIQKKNTVEDSIKRQQRLLLTWLVEEPKLYFKIENLILVEDFTDELYRKIAEMMFAGIKEGNLQPVVIINSFEDLEEQKLATEVFHTRLEAIATPQERERAFHDILVAVKSSSYDYYYKQMKSDVTALNKVIEGKKALEKLKTMRIAIG